MHEDVKDRQKKDGGRRVWESLAEELRKTQDIERMKELVMALEETMFFRQQELALNADKIAKREIEEEERDLTGVLELMLETKTKKLGFPEIKFTAS